MGESEARDFARANAITQPDNTVHVDWGVLFGERHFVPQPVPSPTAQKVESQPDYLRDICQKDGLSMWQDPFKLSCDAYQNFKRFDLNDDGKLTLPELKLIENDIIANNDDRKLAFALDKGFAGLQAISRDKDGITQDGLAKFNHIEDNGYMYALEHHGGSNTGLLTYLGTAIGAGTICWRLGLSFWPAAVVTTAAATAAFLLAERPHNKRQDAELADLHSLQPTVDELIKSARCRL